MTRSVHRLAQRPVDPRFGVSGIYLDVEAAAASIEGVRMQGQTVGPRGG